MKAQHILLLAALLLLTESCKNKTGISPELPAAVVEKIVEPPSKSPRRPIQLDSIAMASLSDTTVRGFYEANFRETFWINDSVKRKQLLQTLGQVKQDGLFPKDFQLSQIALSQNTLDSLTEGELIAYDGLLTQNLLRYITKVRKGSVTPNRFYHDYALRDKEFDPSEWLLHFREGDFDTLIARTRPQHKVYRQLQTALQLLDSFPNEVFVPIVWEEKIEPGDSLPVLQAIKERLVFWRDLSASEGFGWVYDETTQQAVKKFQYRHGLAPDGIVGKQTLRALNISPQERRVQVIANMERWRWYPDDFGDSYLLINIPDYSLRVVEEQDTVRTHKIIVGLPARRTPVLTSRLSYLVFNPTWTLPPTIKKNDVVPAIRRDRNYLIEKNMTVFDRDGEAVAPEDWDETKALSYRYVQSPGPHNSLGLVKFMFANRFAVYLHDTNSKRFFDRANRSLSSGCVRVQDPFLLAGHLLEGQDRYVPDSIDSIIAERKTREVSLRKEVWLHLLYWTAWSDQGELHFRDDLYEKDAALYKALEENEGVGE